MPLFVSHGLMFDDQYERLRLLGEGAFGAAHLVRERRRPDAPLKVAKEIRTAQLSKREREAARVESELLRLMSHPNIIGYVAFFMEAFKFYIVMEYADGGDLSELITARREAEETFRESEVMFIHLQLVLALMHVHGHKILHRDLKPLNVFLTCQGVVKLGDFGVSRVLDSTALGAQTTIGTPLYISPEVCNNEAYGTKSDLWSLGVLTYELVALRVPFHGASLPALVMKICSARPEPLPRQYSAHLARVVFDLLEKSPRQRPELREIISRPHSREHIASLRAHSLESGSGGCEGMVTQRRVEKALQDQTQSPRPKPAKVSGSSLRPNVEPRCGDVATGRGQIQPNDEAWRAAVREEFHRNRELAQRAKQRARGDHFGHHPLLLPPSVVAAGAEETRLPASVTDRRGRSASPLLRHSPEPAMPPEYVLRSVGQQMFGRRSASLSEPVGEPDVEEDRAMSVRRRSQQGRAYREAEHLRQLEEARRAAHLDRQLARERARAERSTVPRSPRSKPPADAAVEVLEATMLPPPVLKDVDLRLSSLRMPELVHDHTLYPRSGHVSSSAPPGDVPYLQELLAAALEPEEEEVVPAVPAGGGSVPGGPRQAAMGRPQEEHLQAPTVVSVTLHVECASKAPLENTMDSLAFSTTGSSARFESDSLEGGTPTVDTAASESAPWQLTAAALPLAASTACATSATGHFNKQEGIRRALSPVAAAQAIQISEAWRESLEPADASGGPANVQTADAKSADRRPSAADGVVNKIPAVAWPATAEQATAKAAATETVAVQEVAGCTALGAPAMEAHRLAFTAADQRTLSGTEERTARKGCCCSLM